MNPGTQDTDIILAVVRGEEPWSALSTIGISIVFGADRVTVDNPRLVVPRAKAADVARGLVSLRADARAPQDWATVVLGGCSFLELSLEDDPSG